MVLDRTISCGLGVATKLEYCSIRRVKRTLCVCHILGPVPLGGIVHSFGKSRRARPNQGPHQFQGRMRSAGRGQRSGRRSIESPRWALLTVQCECHSPLPFCRHSSLSLSASRSSQAKRVEVELLEDAARHSALITAIVSRMSSAIVMEPTESEKFSDETVESNNVGCAKESPRWLTVSSGKNVKRDAFSEVTVERNSDVFLIVSVKNQSFLEVFFEVEVSF